MDQQTLDEATEQKVEIVDPETIESLEPQEWSVSDPEGTNDDRAPQHLAPAAERHVDWAAAQKPSQYVVVWTHLLTEPHHWANAHAQVLPNGTLLIHERNKSVPVKGYAAGAWSEFEHVGDYRPVERPSVDDHNRKRQQDKASMAPYTTTKIEQQYPGARVIQVQDAVNVELPKTDVDDTQNIPVVREDTEPPAGGGEGPKAPAGPGSRFGTASPAPRGSDRSEDDEEPTVGPLRAFWRSLKIAPPAE